VSAREADSVLDPMLLLLPVSTRVAVGVLLGVEDSEALGCSYEFEAVVLGVAEPVVEMLDVVDADGRSRDALVERDTDAVADTVSEVVGCVPLTSADVDGVSLPDSVAEALVALPSVDVEREALEDHVADASVRDGCSEPLHDEVLEFVAEGVSLVESDAAFMESEWDAVAMPLTVLEPELVVDADGGMLSE
jgi:hypothetical protein